MAQQLTNPQEKIEYYRKAAAEAEKSANRASDPKIRETYFGIMRTWIYLAEELEREIGVSIEQMPDDHEVVMPQRAYEHARKSR